MTAPNVALEHHGVKGMHWGVRKADPGGSGSGGSGKPTRAEKKVAKQDERWSKSISKANEGKLTLEFHNEVVTRLNARVDALNASEKYRNVDMHTYHGKMKSDYERDSQEELLRGFEDATRVHYGYNASGTKRAVYNRKTDHIDIVDAPKPPVRHAATQTGTAPDVSLKLKRNARGLIDSVTVLPLQHAILEFDAEAFLEHHGIKGMKWGVRKAERNSPDVTISTNPSKNKRVRVTGGKGHDIHPDAAVALEGKQKAKASGVHTLSNAELKRTVDRMNLEQQYVRLSNPGKGEGQKFVEQQLKSIGQQRVQQLAAGKK